MPLLAVFRSTKEGQIQAALLSVEDIAHMHFNKQAPPSDRYVLHIGIRGRDTISVYDLSQEDAYEALVQWEKERDSSDEEEK